MKRGRGAAVPMEGKRFGALVVLRRAPRILTGRKMAAWVCRCDCGAECVKIGMRLRQNHVKSCGQDGCSWWNFLPPGNTRLHPAEYISWEKMHERCRGTDAKDRRNYRDRGITVCERWKSFDNFLADMGEKPSAKHTIDRIENEGNYEPGNCKWSTPTEQMRNTRRSIYVEHNGQRILLVELTEQLGLSWDEAGKHFNTFWHDLARAAIEAMREPSEEMKQAAARGVSDSFHEEGFQEGDDPSLWNEFVKAGERAWKNALATALKEQP